MARLYIVRHGNTFDEGETVTRIGARTDLHLSTSGRIQAKRLADCFRQTRFTAALASPLIRTRETARTMLSWRTDSPALLIAPFLTEVDYGPDENEPEWKVAARLGPALEAWDRDAAVPPGWIVEIDAIRAGWRGLISRAADLPEDAAALVVTSNGIARFLPDLVDAAPKGLDRKLKTGAFGELLVDAGRAEILRWNVRP
jgi:broad specificity phosphatase PhoE